MQNLLQQKPIVEIKRVDPYAELPKEQRKRIVKLIRAAKLKGKIPKSVQQSIPYLEMRKDGVCNTEPNHYNKTIEFFDINYRLCRDEDQNAIFENWCTFLNSFDNTVSVTFSFINQKTDVDQIYESIAVKEQEDGLDVLREEYMAILRRQLERGNNGLIKRKFITFGIVDEDKETATKRLERIELTLINSFKQLGSRCYCLNGYQRLELLHDILNTGTDRKLNFNWGLLAKTGFSTKDFICPGSFDFRERRSFGLEETQGRASMLLITAPELNDDVLSELLELENESILTLHIQAVAQNSALKMMKDQLANLQGMQMQHQMKLSQQGVTLDIMPIDLLNNTEEATDMIHNLQKRNERMFLVTVLLCDFTKEASEIDINFSTAKQIALKHGCELIPLDWRQETGLMSSLPLGCDLIKNERMLTTSSTAVFIPFQTQELFQKNGLYYGVNVVSENLIMIDRKSIQNPNGLILGTPGSGKGMAAKSEITAVGLCYEDDIIIIDPEREYFPIVNAFDGQVIRISADSKDYINPMDINLFAQNEEDKDYDPVAAKSDFITSFCEQILSGKRQLEPLEMSVIDRCVLKIYDEFAKDPRPEKMPILQDLYELLLNQPEEEAKRIAIGLERYVTGSLNVFNHRTNIDINNRIVCFDTKDLGKQLKKLGMLVVQDQVWNRVTINRAQSKSTRYYVDEFHLLLQDEQTASSAAEMWKRFRKWGGVPTGITQNVSDFIRSPEVKNIFKNSPFVMLLNQARDDQSILAQELEISQYQMNFVTNSQPGEGLIYFDGTILPFNNRLPTDSKLYALMTTKLGEAAKQ